MSIPAKVHASSAVAQGERYEGELAVKLLPRLSAAVPAAGRRLQVQVEASNAAGYPTLSGWIRGRLPLQCRRCGEPFDWPLDLPVRLRLVGSEEEERQALHDSDPYRIEHDELVLREIVEEEVLLALPMLPRCQSCENVLAAASPTGAPPESKEPRRENPFAALKKQLKL